MALINLKNNETITFADPHCCVGARS